MRTGAHAKQNGSAAERKLAENSAGAGKKQEARSASYSSCESSPRSPNELEQLLEENATFKKSEEEAPSYEDMSSDELNKRIRYDEWVTWKKERKSEERREFIEDLRRIVNYKLNIKNVIVGLNLAINNSNYGKSASCSERVKCMSAGVVIDSNRSMELSTSLWVYGSQLHASEQTDIEISWESVLSDLMQIVVEHKRKVEYRLPTLKETNNSWRFWLNHVLADICEETYSWMEFENEILVNPLQYPTGWKNVDFKLPTAKRVRDLKYEAVVYEKTLKRSAASLRQGRHGVTPKNL
ncbi:uncharacterized protein NEMAJ01_0150 [Nematocida major]|uniref:uncharacterized protein n=1 Tax=Nematocida major TaxID=1912982 RepID=UPI0020073C38|nr:uncharacterized protein NEMAJ01_0150 [Nematocida major]KAH9385254.1 hypothetical protein NEMAJ01_0150 [Nematocida major]